MFLFLSHWEEKINTESLINVAGWVSHNELEGIKWITGTTTAQSQELQTKLNDEIRNRRLLLKMFFKKTWKFLHFYRELKKVVF